MALRYLPAARKDIKDALKWSFENFGRPAARRYQHLIGVVLSEIAANPKLQHSYGVSELQPGIRLYHLRHSRKRAVVDGKFVRAPRHFVAYSIRESDVVIVRVVHDRMEITQPLEEACERSSRRAGLGI